MQFVTLYQIAGYYSTLPAQRNDLIDTGGDLLRCAVDSTEACKDAGLARKVLAVTIACRRQASQAWKDTLPSLNHGVSVEDIKHLQIGDAAIVQHVEEEWSKLCPQTSASSGWHTGNPQSQYYPPPYPQLVGPQSLPPPPSTARPGISTGNWRPIRRPN